MHPFLAIALAVVLFVRSWFAGVRRAFQELPRFRALTLLWRPLLARQFSHRFAGADGITGLATTFNLPNYHGMLLQITPSDTPLLSAIGGLVPGQDQVVENTEFGWSAFDLRDADQRTRLEGADAPTAEERKRAQIKNVAQIHQEAVAVSYTKLAAAQRLDGLNTGGERNVVVDESAWQIEQHVKQAARDVEFSFLRGQYHLPADNTTARKTRGLIEAAEEGPPAGIAGGPNVIDFAAAGKAFTVEADDETFTSAAHGYTANDQVVISELVGGTGLENDRVYYVRDVAANTFTVSLTPGGAAVAVTLDGSGTVQELAELDGDGLIDLLQLVWDQGGIREAETATLIANSFNKRGLSREFISEKGYQEQSRNVGGVNLQTIETDFGRLNIMLNRYMPAHKVVVASLEQLKPRFLLVPEKGVFFVEPLAKTGAQEKSQLYGEVGLEYGNPLAHGVARGYSVR